MSKFETKEQYLNFISAWKSATNAEECKAKNVVCDYEEYRWQGFTSEEKAELEAKGYTVKKHSFIKPNGGHYKTDTWLYASHYIFRNMMLGKSAMRGFSPLTSKRKLPQYGSPWIGFMNGAWQLERVISEATHYIEQLGLGKADKYAGHVVTAFLKPFSGKITIADLAKIDISELKDMYTVISKLTTV